MTQIVTAHYNQELGISIGHFAIFLGTGAMKLVT